jgi:Tfp pilus assembly protein PilE
MLVIVAAVILVVLLSVAERLRRAAVARRHRRVAESRLGAVMRETEKRLERERAKKAQAAALTSVVPAIQKPNTRHVA